MNAVLVLGIASLITTIIITFINTRTKNKYDYYLWKLQKLDEIRKTISSDKVVSIKNAILHKSIVSTQAGDKKIVEAYQSLNTIAAHLLSLCVFSKFLFSINDVETFKKLESERVKIDNEILETYQKASLSDPAAISAGDIPPTVVKLLMDAYMVNLEQIYTIDDMLEKEMLNLRCQFEQSGEAKIKASYFKFKK